MKYLKTLLFAGLAMATGVGAVSAQDMYAGVNLGVNFTHDGDLADDGVPIGTTKFDAAAAAGGYVGVDLGDFRVEGELSYRSNDVDTVDGEPEPGSSISTIALMVNALYDFDTGSVFTPYIGGGLGVGFSEFDATIVTGDTTGLAGQFIVGGSYAISGTLDLTVDYRLFTMGEPEYELGVDTVTVEYWNSTISLGLRTRF